jgi:hypothetical protein
MSGRQQRERASIEMRVLTTERAGGVKGYNWDSRVRP